MKFARRHCLRETEKFTVSLSESPTVRFYVPEWDDNVDAHYDFEHDEHSKLNPSERDLQYIWDIFDPSTLPIDGVLISREQVGESQAKHDRFVEHGVYEPGSHLDVPDWLPTISDCGAWGYKSLPFPPYDNQEMLEFYDDLNVSVGVTVDHLVLGSGEAGRLYLDERAFTNSFTEDDLPDALTDTFDVMVAAWPDEWPDYVEEEAPAVYETDSVDPFDPSLFEGTAETVQERLSDDPRAVYRKDDTQFRYELTLQNAAEMHEIYEANDYSFRLMAAVQGWNPASYAQATKKTLQQGYQYLGIGGVAGSPTGVVQDIMAAIGNIVKEHEREYTTRIDTHVFGFAKTDAFDTAGRSGMTSFDSASMLRSAWTGGKNYHLTSGKRYDALRVRFPQNGEDLSTSIEKALRAQELLHALRAFDDNESIAEAIHAWYQTAEQAIEELDSYLWEHRWDDAYNASRLRDIKEHFRSDYAHGRELKGSFSTRFRRRLAKLLRADDPEDPVDRAEYETLIENAKAVLQDFPRMLAQVEQQENDSDRCGTFEQVWLLVKDYATWIGDEGHLDAYEELLQAEPWRECTCTLCEEYGIDIAIFRGNNRNRRRGFHNKRRFYDQFEDDLPKVLVVTPATAQMSGPPTIESHLAKHQSAFWQVVHDLPVAEIGTVSAQGFHEWWEPTPPTVSLDPDQMAASLADTATRYQEIFVYIPDHPLRDQVHDAIDGEDCQLRQYTDPANLRQAVLDRLGYEADFLPDHPIQTSLPGL